MTFNLGDPSALVTTFMWPFMRVGGVIFAAPVFGTRLVPVKVRIMLTLVTTILLIPLIPEIKGIAPFSALGFYVSVQQIIIGLTLGFMLQLVFSALILAGESMAMSMGLGFASMIDPQHGVSVPVLSQFFILLATLIYLSINGHIVLLSILAESFHSLPISAQGFDAEVFEALAKWAGFIFAAAVKIALPVVASLLMAYIALGVMTRAAPQMNIFSVGFPLTILIGFIAIYISMPTFLPVFTTLLEDTLAIMFDIVRP